MLFTIYNSTLPSFCRYIELCHNGTLSKDAEIWIFHTKHDLMYIFDKAKRLASGNNGNTKIYPAYYMAFNI